ncbi:MAG: CocE/NonD family hydrolase [Terriglobales bacterium]
MLKCTLRLAAVLVLTLTAFAQQPFNRSEVMVPMRDGVKLQTVILAPKDAKAPLPILLTRTPYGVPDEKGAAQLAERFPELIADGYIFVTQNIRGKFRSEGEFRMIRPLRDPRDPKATDESTDAYDTIEWLVKNVAGNNGRVGIWGVSYPGWTTVMALLSPHPALKAASEQASPADMFLGDDFHHNGAFRLDYGFEYAALMESSKDNKPFEFDRYDLYDWYLELGALGNVDAKYFHGQVPTWNDFVKHPNYDSFWRVRAFDPYLRITSVPNLNVAGWWDQEDFYGPQRIYRLLEANDARRLNYFVAGPWNHGGWLRSSGKELGPVDFGSETAKEFRARLLALWFRFWLHGDGKGEPPVAEATTFQTGTNQWKTYDSWPPKNATARKLYFRAGGKLSFDAPTETGDAFDSYVSDPANPVPYRPRPIRPINTAEWREWLVEDQRFVDHRPDVLTWQTEPLTDDVVITGEITANLFAATSGTDSDWVVKLIDVYPDDFKPPEKSDKGPCKRLTGGYQLIIAHEVFRARFRNSFERPEPVPADKVVEYKFSLHTNDHVFLKGHRIMVQVQSTWFPLIDRNPQKYVDNIYKASDADYVKATQRIYRSAEAASSVVLPVMQ